MARITAGDRAATDSRRVERVYSVLSKVYDAFFDWALGPGRSPAIERMPIKPGDRVLEVGVGTGLSLPHYPPGCHVTGIDISEPMLDRARQRANELDETQIDLRVMDARELRFADASFDHVVAPYVISVVPEPERVMAEIRRVSKPGGTVVVVNHFRSQRPVLRSMDAWLTPLSQWIGFRMDLPLEAVTETPGFEVEAVERINLLGMWRLIVMKRADEPLAAGVPRAKVVGGQG